MGTPGGRATPVDRVVEIRADLDAARRRIAVTLEALRYKADMPARLGDLLGTMASEFMAHVIDRATPAMSNEATPEDGMTVPMPSETDSWRVDEGAPSGHSPS
jgi:hypothetical protein